MQGFFVDRGARSPSFLAASDTRSFGQDQVDLLIRLARGRSGVARVCLHQSSQDTLHSMLVAQAARRYWRPKRHQSKFKIFHIVRGSMVVVMFDTEGDVIYYEELEPQGKLAVLVPANVFHTNIALSEVAVHHEVIEGPFVADETDREIAKFAPCESDTEASVRYLTELVKKQIPDA